jgi:predicted lipoprotein with Yx(FWY)xxD motif
MRARLALLGIVLLGGLAACGSPTAATPNLAEGVKVGQSSLGPILTDLEGRTLYAFAKDKDQGSSTCDQDCLASWPALTSDQDFEAKDGAEAELLTATKRTDGVEQAKYGVWPLYYYAGDQGPGDIDGQNVDGVWFVLGADGKLIKRTP